MNLRIQGSKDLRCRLLVAKFILQVLDLFDYGRGKVAKNGLGGRLGARRETRVEDFPSSAKLGGSGQHRSTTVKSRSKPPRRQNRDTLDDLFTTTSRIHRDLHSFSESTAVVVCFLGVDHRTHHSQQSSFSTLNVVAAASLATWICCRFMFRSKGQLWVNSFWINSAKRNSQNGYFWIIEIVHFGDWDLLDLLFWWERVLDPRQTQIQIHYGQVDSSRQARINFGNLQIMNGLWSG
ncbi:hypothetical protein LXL04_039305 [Taraxacum kok-saghyz]